MTQWWDHVPSESAATAVSVAAGAFQSNVDFALTPLPNALTLDGVAIDGVTQGQSQSVTHDGSVATCVGCLVVRRGQPVVTAVIQRTCARASGRSRSPASTCSE